MAIIVTKQGKDAKKLEKSDFDKENHLQKNIFDNPEIIPLYDIDENIRLLVLCREFPTKSGPIDALGIDRVGNIYVIETKLYKNPDKRLVVAQVLDYGASLWNSYSLDSFTKQIDDITNKNLQVNLRQRIGDFYGLEESEIEGVINNIGSNLKEGSFKFVVLMDKLHKRLKDLIIFLNQNSEFDIYAVELEYYKFESYEILIPRIYGAEVKKDNPHKVTTQWSLSNFLQRIRETSGEDGVKVVNQLVKWCEQKEISIYWGTSQVGSFIPCFYSGEKGFYPFSIQGNGGIIWNVRGNKIPVPFNDMEKKRQILKRIEQIKGSTVDLNNINGYSAIKLPINLLASKESFDKFCDTLLWIRDSLATSL